MSKICKVANELHKVSNVKKVITLELLVSLVSILSNDDKMLLNSMLNNVKAYINEVNDNVI